MKYPALLSMLIVTGSLIAGLAGRAAAQTTSSDDFTQPSDTNSWVTFDGACLTAGDGTASSIPACVGLPYYGTQIQIGGHHGYLGNRIAPSSAASQRPDQPGHGALRFTNWYGQAGSIISSGTPFPTGTGLQVVFKTITYDGDNGGAGGDGADGMAFFLMDGSLPPYDTGAFGGSLGYTCTNELGNNDGTLRADGTVRGFDGLVGGYIGLGIDEYGNFLNPGDNTATGPGYQPGRIGLRGKGSISFGWLNSNFPTLYPSSLLTAPSNYGGNPGPPTAATDAVHDTCRTGHLWDYSNPATPLDTGTPVLDYAPVGSPVILSNILPGYNIANEGAATRDSAQPITYALKITQNGILSLNISYNGGSYQPVITKQDITAANGALPPSFRFGFTGSTGGSRNIHEILCFQAAPSDVAGTSVGVNEQEATKIASGTQAYLAFYYPGDNTGRLTANNLLFNGTNIYIAATANWDASCNLTGVLSGETCASTGGGTAPAQAPASRAMLSWDGGQGVAFEWNSGPGGNISGAQQNTLDAGDTAPFNANRLQYLRGDRSNEINTLGVGLFRARDGVLGDIVDSSPTWVGPPTTHYSALWRDQLIPADPTPENTGTQSFLQYINAMQTRLNVVYSGANDGFLHGFESGSFDVNGVYVNNATTPNDGLEVLAYMPGAVVNTIHNAVDGTQDFPGPQYSHNFYVDATPDVDDVFYTGAWHTWLVGGLGAGGAAIYALDVTDPTTFSESNAKNLVMGEWSSATIGCINVTGCGVNMGNTYGTPMVRRLHDGNWAVIFGNGFGSKSGDAGIFIMLLDANGKTQSSNTYYLSTGMGSGSTGVSITFTAAPTGTSGTLSSIPAVANGIWGITFSDGEFRTAQISGTSVTWTGALTGTPTTVATVQGDDGIAYVTSADLDGDHITDYVYAGDLLGNVWRFDLTSAVESNWAAASTPLFTTGSGQPITTKLQVISVPQGAGPPRIMIDFGTGQKFPPTNLVPTSYQAGVQYLYGVWDWNLGNWNGMSGTQYLSLPSGPTTAPSGSLNSSNLQSQTLTPVVESDGTNALDITSNVVCWAASGTCTGGNNQFGFAVALPGAQEQIVFNPLVFQNALVVNTTIPAVNSPSSCTVLHDTGNTIAISLVTGGSLGNNVTGSYFVGSTDPNLAGSQTNGTGTPFPAQAGGMTFILTQSLGDVPGGSGGTTGGGGTGGGGGGGIIACSGKFCSGGVQAATLTSKRLTWVERR
jgi:type IV pilus assembly protein PilY1